MAECDFRLRNELPAGRILDDFVKRADGLALATEQTVTVSRKVIAPRALFRLRGICGEPLEQRRGHGILPVIVMIRRQGVGGGGGPLAIAVAVQQGTETAFPVINLTGLIEAVAQIPPGHFGIGMIRKRAEVVVENLGGPLISIPLAFLVGARLGRVVEIFPALEKIVRGIRG
jgi:hypothetical protein